MFDLIFLHVLPLSRETYMTIMNWPGSTSDTTPRVVWCPYVAENPSDPSDVVNMVALFKVGAVYECCRHMLMLVRA